MKESTYIIIYPNKHTWKQRLTVIFSQLLGLKYHHKISRENVEQLVENLVS